MRLMKYLLVGSLDLFADPPNWNGGEVAFVVVAPNENPAVWDEAEVGGADPTLPNIVDCPLPVPPSPNIKQRKEITVTKNISTFIES